MNDSMTDALREYLPLRQRLIELDARESECKCDAQEFHCCDLCREHHELQNIVNSIMHLWAEDFTVALAIHEGLMQEEKFPPATERKLS